MVDVLFIAGGSFIYWSSCFLMYDYWCTATFFMMKRIICIHTVFVQVLYQARQVPVPFPCDKNYASIARPAWNSSFLTQLISICNRITHTFACLYSWVPLRVVRKRKLCVWNSTLTSGAHNPLSAEMSTATTITTQRTVFCNVMFSYGFKSRNNGTVFVLLLIVHIERTLLLIWNIKFLKILQIKKKDRRNKKFAYVERYF